jgi:hypothetical protein
VRLKHDKVMFELNMGVLVKENTKLKHDKAFLDLRLYFSLKEIRVWF